jgi:hypothetical protein
LPTSSSTSLENTLPDSHYASTTQAVHDWRAAWASADRPQLRYWSSPGYLHIEDSRDTDHAGTYTFEDDLATLYLACSETPRTASLRASLTAAMARPTSPPR